MAGSDIFDADHDCFITEALFNVNVLTSSFSFAVVKSNNDGNNHRRKYALVFNILDTDKGDFNSKAEFNYASGSPFRPV